MRSASRSSLAFPPTRRVRKHADFQRIQAPASRSGRATTAHFVFLLARSPVAPVAEVAARSPSRLGVVVTRKLGGAPERNRVKRLCRECFRLWPDFLVDGVDLVVIARMGAPALGLAEVRAEWARVQGALRQRAREALAQPPPQPHVCGHAPTESTVSAGKPSEDGRNQA